jgi:hypothetical protein
MKRWDDLGREMLVDINKTPVLKEELLRIVDDIEASFPGSRDIMAYAAAAKNVTRDPDKMEAVMFRLQALFRLLSDEGAPGWTIALPDGVLLTPEPVFAAAAIHPLIVLDDEVTFDRETFLVTVLELADLKQIG